ncbi:MAG: translation initiation factor [Herbinix sp.]|jgi:translation initiation factor IF-2|nr:translation initiation factor [Herbinix sp.]
MAKMKIFELKNQINEQTKGAIESKDIQDYLEKSFGVKKTHSSNLEDNEVQFVKNHFVQSSKAAQAPIQKPAGQPVPRPATSVTAQSVAPHTGTRPVGMGTTQGAQRPMGGQSSQSTARPTTGQQQTGIRQGQPSQHNGQRPAGEQGHQGTNTQSTIAQGQRPAGGQNGMRQGQQGYQGQGYQGQQGQQGQGYQGQQGGQQGQGYQGSHSTTARPAGEQGQHTTSPRPAGQGYQGQRPQGQDGQRPAGQGYQGQRPQGQDGQRPAGQGYQGQRPQGQGYQGNRPAGEGYQGNRPAGQGYQGNRPAGEGYQGNRPAGQGYQGNRPAGEGYQGNRPAGEGYQGNRPAGQGYQGNRPQGQGYQGNRPAGEGYQGNRPAGEGYQGNRPAGQGYQGNRPAGQGYQGNRPAGEGYQGNRPAGQGYQGNRPAGQGYQGNRPAGEGYQGNRPAGQGYQGNRPAGEGYQGNRPAGQGYQGNRPATPGGQRTGGYGGGTSNYSRPSGGFSPRGFEGGNKDDDDKPSYNRSGAGAKKGAGPARPGERKNFDQQILDKKVAEKNDNNNKRNRDRINKEKNYKDKNLVGRDDSDSDNIKTYKKGQFIQPKPLPVVKEEEIKVIAIPEVLTIKDLADKMKKPSAALIKKLFLAGKIVTLNQEITFEEAEEIALEYDIIAEKEVKVNEVEELLKEEDEDQETMNKRPPVVCVMGHVDHGKTSLLDAIRETNVTSREAGGITQHIGAYIVEVNGEKITFLDTPGHEAFTSMRMRGAKSTDIAILVIAADDGVMPQTVEAINHAKAAGVQIIVAINKVDKPSANIERVKQELTEYELVAEDWGGDTIFVPVSAHTKEGIERLLEMILLTAEMLELKANPDRNARGIVIEAELDKGRGPVATILVQKGTLRVGDNVAVGSSFGKVRAMMDDKGRRVKEATPSTPVEILGLNEVPDAGETFLVTDNEKEARIIAEAYLSQGKERLLSDTKAKLSLDGLFSQIQAGNIKELNLIIKADVQGSVEAMKQSLVKLSNKEVAVRIIHGGVGAINESDVILASASNAIIIGFNVKPDNAAKETADRENVDVKLYRVIYNAISDIEAAMKGMLDPIFEERIIGHAEIRMTFKASGIGTIAGSYVLDGKIIRGSKCRIYRDNSLVYEGILTSLKRFQDDVKEVDKGYECGLVFDKFNEVKEGDKVELFVMSEVPR